MQIDPQMNVFVIKWRFRAQMGWIDLFSPNWLEERHPQIARPDPFRGPQLSVSPDVSVPPRSTVLGAPHSSFRDSPRRPTRVQEAAPTACSATARTLPRRRAVLVGIDHRSAGWRLSAGCLDALRFQLLLTRYFDFCSTDFKLFVEADNDGNVVGRPPTKHNLLEGLEWLVSDSQAGDILLFYFAGMSTESGVPAPITGFPKLNAQSLVTQDLQLLSAAEFNRLLSRAGGGTQVACFFDTQFSDSFVPLPARLILDRRRAPRVERTPGGRRQSCKGQWNPAMFSSPWAARALPYETASPAVADDCSLEQHSVFVFRYAYGSPAVEHERTGGLLTSALVAAAFNLAQDEGVDGASWSDWANATRASLSGTPFPSVGEYLDVRLELAFATTPHALRILSHEPADSGRPVWTAALASAIPIRRAAPVTVPLTTFRINSLHHIRCPTGKLQVRVVARGNTVARTCWRPVTSTACGYTCEWSEDLSVPATPSTVRLEVHSKRCLGVTEPYQVGDERSLVPVFTTDGTNASFGLLSLSTSTQSLETPMSAPKHPATVVENPRAVVVPISERRLQTLRQVPHTERAPAGSNKRVQFDDRPTLLVSEASTETSTAPRLSQCSKCGGKFKEVHTCGTCLEWACILCGCTSCTESSN